MDDPGFQDALQTLPDQERRTIELRYGFEEKEPKTLQEVADRFGVTRHHVRVIERRALYELRRVLGLDPLPE